MCKLQEKRVNQWEIMVRMLTLGSTRKDIAMSPDAKNSDTQQSDEVFWRKQLALKRKKRKKQLALKRKKGN